MQPAPLRLQRAIWSAFRASKPVTSSIARGCFEQLAPSRAARRQVFQPAQRWQPSALSQVRFYSDDKKSDVAAKLEDARQRIGETIESKADNVINLPGPELDSVKNKEDETIVHTYPESSSIVYNPDSPGESAAKGAASTLDARADDADTRTSSDGQDTFSRPQSSPGPSDSSSDDPLPSQLAARYSRVREHFTDFMDNFQTHVFTASKRLNDLTGYSSIEQLKKEIEEQEHKTRRARQHVKDSRTAYQTAIATRSDTQREVNDLLHRKHAWSAQDLERFTNLYRSDHANEQAEQKAHSELAQAEAAYEEASTKLSKSILARYHEEQVWSDKIRQMSTWGTWGLMGLNVLLFIIFQILVEPWRRRRLVRGFEEKVQEALKEQSAEQELRTIFHISKAQEGALSAAAGASAETNVRAAGQEDDDPRQEPAQITQAETTDPPIEEMAQRTVIEQAAESVTIAEVAAEHTVQPAFANSAPDATTQSTAAPAVETSAVADPSQAPLDADAQPLQSTPSGPLPNISDAGYKDIPFRLGTYTRQYLNIGNAKLWALFDEQREVTISQRDLTAKVLEGAFVGAVGVVCFFWAVGISSGRAR